MRRSHLLSILCIAMLAGCASTERWNEAENTATTLSTEEIAAFVEDVEVTSADRAEVQLAFDNSGDLARVHDALGAVQPAHLETADAICEQLDRTVFSTDVDLGAAEVAAMAVSNLSLQNGLIAEVANLARLREDCPGPGPHRLMGMLSAYASVEAMVR